MQKRDYNRCMGLFEASGLCRMILLTGKSQFLQIRQGPFICLPRMLPGLLRTGSLWKIQMELRCYEWKINLQFLRWIPDHTLFQASSISPHSFSKPEVLGLLNQIMPGRITIRPGMIPLRRLRKTISPFGSDPRRADLSWQRQLLFQE
jgi:hypothetical protein